MNKETLVSGITATGNLTLGNYLGAIKNFIKLQNKYEMYIFVADIHALTNNIDKETLKNNREKIMALYLAAGLDPKKVTLFYQSQVKAHSVLGWILLMQTTMGVLSRITQFKDKSQKIQTNNGTDSIPTGLFAYPALMAADILLYNPDIVPVGQDQKQHLELTQSISKRFNNKYGQTFNIPKPYISQDAAKIMSLTDPTVKMSKSSNNPKSYISLLDSPRIAHKKIMSAKTDSENKIYISENKPGILNLLVIYSGLKSIKLETAANHFKNKNYKELKEETSQVVCDFLTELQLNYEKHKHSITKVSEAGAINANKVANQNLEKVLNKLGL